MTILHALTIRHPELLTEIGVSITIPNRPYLSLHIESIGEGPRGLPALSIAQYGSTHGDLMRDPEMQFEMEIEDGSVKAFHPYFFRNDYIGTRQSSVVYQGQDNEGRPVCRVDVLMLAGQREFAVTWDRYLAAQRFLRVTEYAVNHEQPAARKRTAPAAKQRTHS